VYNVHRLMTERDVHSPKYTCSTQYIHDRVKIFTLRQAFTDNSLTGISLVHGNSTTPENID